MRPILFFFLVVVINFISGEVNCHTRACVRTRVKSRLLESLAVRVADSTDADDRRWVGVEKMVDFIGFNFFFQIRTKKTPFCGEIRFFT